MEKLFKRKCLQHRLNEVECLATAVFLHVFSNKYNCISRIDRALAIATYSCKNVLLCISGSLLLDSLLSHLTTPEKQNCKAVYLHVLTTNSAAMKFYDKKHFRQFRYLPLYYAIDGMHKDGFSYALYINGGEPPWTLAYPLKFVVFFFV